MSSSTRRVPQGLPSNPRSRLAGGAPPSRLSEERRQPRTMPTPRARDPQFQREQVPDTTMGLYHTRQGEEYRETRHARRSGDSSSTASPEPSPFWARGNTSQRSSRTTVQSDEGVEYTELVRDSHLNDTQDLDHSLPTVKDTAYVWGRVTEAANVFTQEVSKVWATGLGGERGDEGEPESHLTHVMRAYHLSKARTPAELPDWLFNERERGQGGLLRFDTPDDGGQVKPEPAQLTQRRANRPPIYQDVTAVSLGQSKSLKTTMQPAQAKISGSDRLKQLRELRRSASRV
ncbi:hypothetical protein GALMADRAFT_135001 [Galerina marginata CBS 339.88]|uniref:Uncharacterized protein n=1 Tax=Galerina marginata (strain CBS 339.88) TaxID=685588 RepID=A0A067TEK3_GALM3|nr:hypothetical protein GALMADRAFT_135001 [Galerina marginata CBS 339.88]